MLIKDAKKKLNQEYEDLKPQIRSGDKVAKEAGLEKANAIQNLCKLESIGIINTWELIDMIPGIVEDLQYKIDMDKAREKAIAVKNKKYEDKMSSNKKKK